MLFAKIQKEQASEDVAKIETTTDEVKPGEKPKTPEPSKPEPSPASEKEEPLFKSSLRMKPKAKVSFGSYGGFRSEFCFF